MTRAATPPIDAWACAVVFASVPFRMVLATTTDLSPDEAYYLAAARTGWTIPDHPPLVLWLARFGDCLPWLTLELRIRLPAILLATLTAAALVELVRRRGAGPGQQRWAACASSWLALPLAGGFLATPDAPLACAIVALALLHELDRPSPLSWILVGLSAWVGTMAKVVMIPIAAVTALASGRRAAVASALGAALALPWIIPSLSMQAGHAFSPDFAGLGARAIALLALVGAQLALWTPPLLILGLAEVMRHPFDRTVVLTLTGLVLASALATGRPPEPNWWAPAGILVVAAASGRIHAASPRVRIATLLLGPALSVIVATHVAWPWIPIAREVDPTARLHGWRTASPPVSAPGVGGYGPDAARCVYQGECGSFSK